MSLAIVFPGQGSQSTGMMAALAEKYPPVKSHFAEASSILGYDLWDLVQNGPEAELNQTARTQPALLTASVALWQIWRELNGPAPRLLAGHSLGEYSALVCSGTLAFKDAVALVADRGKYMQEAVPEGTGSMAAILGLTCAQVIEICEKAARGEIVAAANFNSTEQIVIAGHKSAVNRAMELATAAGAKRSILLPVSVPSHCALMHGAARKLDQRLQSINLAPTQIPVIHNADVSEKTGAAAIRQALVAQLYQPVRWVETIEHLAKAGVKKIVECGPGKVLCGLIRRIDRNIETIPVYDPVSLDQALMAVKSCSKYD